MDIARVWMSQRNLRRAEQIPEMIRSINDGDQLPPVVLVCCEDDEIQLHDGHHRLTAYWLAGRRRLARHEYIINCPERYNRPRFGKIERLVELINRIEVT